jgi:hypothetical protein
MSYSPTVYPRGSNVDVAWEDNRDGNFEIYHKRSTDCGLTWGPDERLTTDSATSVYPSIVADGENVHIVWFGLGGGAGIFYLHSSDGGASWDPIDTLVSGTCSSPFIDYAGPVLHVIWRDTRSGDTAIYYKRNMNGNVGIDESFKPPAPSRKPAASIVRDGLFLEGDYPRTGTFPKTFLLDAAGRKVMGVHPGANDVTRLGPGVYFVWEQPKLNSHARTSRAVVLIK